ncbi:MAG: hypothetical protein DME17_19200 [Candidatus Rokuibacteriota bacterium]|nr:MAG: hypothetical protein DME17_19200 [Candidatus Rokubacteria bacterium]
MMPMAHGDEERKVQGPHLQPDQGHEEVLHARIDHLNEGEDAERDEQGARDPRQTAERVWASREGHQEPDVGRNHEQDILEQERGGPRVEREGHHTGKG